MGDCCGPSVRTSVCACGEVSGMEMCRRKRFVVGIGFSDVMFEGLTSKPGRRLRVRTGAAVRKVVLRAARRAWSPPRAAIAERGSSGLRRTPGNSRADKFGKVGMSDALAFGWGRCVSRVRGVTAKCGTGSWCSRVSAGGSACKVARCELIQ